MLCLTMLEIFTSPKHMSLRIKLDSILTSTALLNPEYVALNVYDLYN